MKNRKIKLISISMILVLTFLTASSCTFAASKPILKKGMSGTAVKTLQQNLKTLGYFSAAATGYFGDITLTAVKKFQKKYNLPVTGVVASLTHSKIDSLLKARQKKKPADPPKPKPDGLHTGSSGNEVAKLQSDLKALGYMKVDPTGEFGPLTENALIQFQKKYGIEQHGVADKVTLAMIERLLEQDDLSSRGGDERSSSARAELIPLYKVKKEWIKGLHQEPYIDGVGKYQGVVFHYTDNPGDTARIEADYVKTNWENAFVHEFIDANEIIQVADPDYKAWGAGKYANDKFIHLELCDARTKDEFDISYKKIVRRCAEYLYMDQLGVSPAKADGTGTLWAHIDVARYLGGTDHTDPIAYLAKWGKTWSDVIKDVTKEYISISFAGSPEEIVPEEVVQEEVLQEGITSEETTSEEITSEGTVPEETPSENTPLE
jgi:peptidoglycan hydrolase-like protein with peptidoglycan-binding domain